MNKIYKIYSVIILVIMSLFCVLSLEGSKIEAASYDSYYTDVNTTSGQALINSLTDLIDGHKQLGYSNRLSAYPKTDMKDGYIWDMYSNEKYTMSDTGDSASSEGQGFNTEHTVPQSWFNKNEPMRSDLFHIYPTDIKVNSIRSSYLYGETSNPTTVTKNGSKLGSSTFEGYNGTVFEPIDEYKGDLARTYFYMATRYSQQLGSWTAGESQKVFKGSYPYLTTYAINLFMKWHELDPVSEKETSRNNAVQAIQNNRNPYIDHPEYVDMIWSDYKTISSTYKVTYSCDSNVFFNYTDNTKYNSGSLISSPNVIPAKEGYTFIGWTSNLNTKEIWDFNTNKITKNLTLYPLFKASSFEAFTSEVSQIKTQLLTNFVETTNETLAGDGYKKVTNSDDLKAGDKVIVVNENKSVALSKTQNNNNRGQAEVSITNNSISSISNDVQVITLELGSVNGTFAFNVGDGYLYAASSGSNHLKTQNSIDANASFKIDIVNNKTTVIAQGSNTRNNLMYNNSANLFSCYSSGQAEVSIYKEVLTSGTTFEATNVAIKFNYYVTVDVYNAFVDEYYFGFEYNSDYITDVFFEKANYNNEECRQK